jgi:CRP/FNR family transcriptional regulator
MQARIKPLNGQIDASTRAAVASYFAGVGPKPVDELLKTARLRSARPGEYLVLPDQLDQAGLLIEGIGRTVVALRDGRSATIHYVRPVGFVGLPTVYVPIPLSVRAITNATVIGLEAETVQRAAREYPDLGSFLTHQLARAVLRVPTIVEEFGFKTVTQRIASHLMDLSEPEASTGSRVANVTQTTLAEYVGSAREVVSRCLQSLVADGVVTVGYGSIRLVDEAGLRRLTGRP